MKTAPSPDRMVPQHAVPGGRVAIEGSGFEPAYAYLHRVYFGEELAQIVRVSPKKISAVVPEGGAQSVRVEYENLASEPLAVSVASTLAEELHPVANPVFDSLGDLYITLSGSRGEKVPVSIFRIDAQGNVKPFLSEILNPTGMAWGNDDHLYVSSRHDGAVYRVSVDRDVELVADELGVATGIAFDSEGILHVGDRRGTIYRIERNGEPRSFCQLEPSVSAYHLSFGPEGFLYVAGPSLASSEPIYRIDPSGKKEVFADGFGRPQGMAFDENGNLYVTEGLSGDSAVYRIDASGNREILVATPALVGLAFDGKGRTILAGASSVYSLELGVRPLRL